MTKEIVKATETKAVKTMSNGRVKLNRILGNLIKALFGKEKRIAGVDELSIEGCFSRIQKEKNKMKQIMEAQDAAIKERDVKAAADKKVTDDEVARIEKEIADKKKELQDKLAATEAEKVAIASEKERCDRVCKRMDEFFA